MNNGHPPKQELPLFKKSSDPQPIEGIANPGSPLLTVGPTWPNHLGSTPALLSGIADEINALQAHKTTHPVALDQCETQTSTAIALNGQQFVTTVAPYSGNSTALALPALDSLQAVTPACTATSKILNFAALTSPALHSLATVVPIACTAASWDGDSAHAPPGSDVLNATAGAAEAAAEEAGNPALPMPAAKPVDPAPPMPSNAGSYPHSTQPCCLIPGALEARQASPASASDELACILTQAEVCPEPYLEGLIIPATPSVASQESFDDLAASETSPSALTWPVATKSTADSGATLVAL